jgi:uncharacterized protein YjiS (DUF1127 family)
MFKRLWNKAIEMQERRATYWILQNMTDKELRDIGVDRSNIKYRISQCPR